MNSTHIALHLLEHQLIMNITFSIPWCGLGGLGGVVVVVGVFGIAVVNAVCWAGFDCRAGSGLAEASSSPAV